MTKHGIYGIVCEEDMRLDKCKNLLFDVYENSVNRLYDSIDKCLFQDINFHTVLESLPQWVIDLGHSPELNWTKDIYDWHKQIAPSSTINRFIYYYDLWNVVTAIQDRLQTVQFLFESFYSQMPSVSKYQDYQYDSGIRMSGDEENLIHSKLNLLFVSLASTFDLLAKVAHEQRHFSEYDFKKYKEMRYKNIMFNDTGHPDIAPELLLNGMLFSSNKDITTIVEYRNMFVHNGAWDLRNSIYQCRVNGSIVDAVLYSPDLNANGRLERSGSRNCFYSQQNRMNLQLPDLVINVVVILKATIEKLADLYMANVTKTPSQAETNKCFADIKAYYDGYKCEQEKNHENKKKKLCAKYGDKIGLLLANGRICPGASEEQCFDVFGTPYEERDNGDNTKTLLYGGGHYITIRDGKVICVK